MPKRTEVSIILEGGPVNPRKEWSQYKREIGTCLYNLLTNLGYTGKQTFIAKKPVQGSSEREGLHSQQPNQSTNPAENGIYFQAQFGGSKNCWSWFWRVSLEEDLLLLFGRVTEALEEGQHLKDPYTPDQSDYAGEEGSAGDAGEEASAGAIDPDEITSPKTGDQVGVQGPEDPGMHPPTILEDAGQLRQLLEYLFVEEGVREITRSEALKLTRELVGQIDRDFFGTMLQVLTSKRKYLQVKRGSDNLLLTDAGIGFLEGSGVDVSMLFEERSSSVHEEEEVTTTVRRTVRSAVVTEKKTSLAGRSPEQASLAPTTNEHRLREVFVLVCASVFPACDACNSQPRRELLEKILIFMPEAHDAFGTGKTLAAFIDRRWLTVDNGSRQKLWLAKDGVRVIEEMNRQNPGATSNVDPMLPVADPEVHRIPARVVQIIPTNPSPPSKASDMPSRAVSELGIEEIKRLAREFQQAQVLVDTTSEQLDALDGQISDVDAQRQKLVEKRTELKQTLGEAQKWLKSPQHQKAHAEFERLKKIVLDD